ncbi:hypothetical protein ABPG72_011210 [Tetrahymena utriculariae]
MSTNEYIDQFDQNKNMGTYYDNNSYGMQNQQQMDQAYQNPQNEIKEGGDILKINNTQIVIVRQENTVDLKLFVGQLPKTWEKEQVKDFFSKFGRIYEVQIIRDNKGQHKGCAFVKFASMTDAEKAIEAVKNTTFPGMKNNVEIKWADNEEERLGVNQDSDHKLFIGSLPKSCTEQNIKDIFEFFGEIEELHLMKDNQQNTRQAFLKFKQKEKAHLAIRNLNSQVYINDSENPIEVRFAKKYVKLEKPNPTPAPKPDPVPAPQQINKVYFKYYTEENEPYYFHPLLNTSSFDKPGPGSLILDIDGNQEYIDNNPRPTRNDPVVINDRKDVYGKKHGPPGANLFIFHLPNDYRDSDLEKLFKEYGEVISARVNTRPDGTSKGFGFISYNHPSQAEAAITALNGLQIKNKRLKVEIKKEGMDNNGNMIKSNPGSLNQTSFHPF